MTAHDDAMPYDLTDAETFGEGNAPWPKPPVHRLDVHALLPGQMVFTRGTNDFGDERTGGMVVKYDDNPDTGERFVSVVTRSMTTPPPGRLYLSKEKGRGYIDLGPLARMHRLAVSDIDPAATDGFRHVRSVWAMALEALRASTVPPANHHGSALHDGLLTSYRVLRTVAQELAMEAKS